MENVYIKYNYMSENFQFIYVEFKEYIGEKLTKIFSVIKVDITIYKEKEIPEKTVLFKGDNINGTLFCSLYI